MHPQKSNLINLMNSACFEVARRVLRDFNELTYLKANKNIVDFICTTQLRAYEDIKAMLTPSNHGHGFVFNDQIMQTSETGFYWLINPIDNVTNFAHRLPFFAICVVLVENYSQEDKELTQANVIAGILFDPVREESFTVERNKHSFMNTKKLRVVPNELNLIASDRSDSFSFRNIGSSALHAAYFCAGRVDGIYHTFDNATNFAFSKVFVEEAMGEIRVINNKIVASPVGTISLVQKKAARNVL